MNVITTVFRVYLTDQTMEHLAVNLKKGGIKDFLAFLPSNKRNAKTLDAHFRGAGLPQVSDWFTKRQTAAAKEALAQELKERFHAEETNEQVRSFVYHQQPHIESSCVFRLSRLSKSSKLTRGFPTQMLSRPCGKSSCHS